jgi:hypothetical protein
MTPDELPAIEGRVEAFIRWTDPRNTKPFSGSSLQLVSDLRALLKAYQEQRRALEEANARIGVMTGRGERCPQCADTKRDCANAIAAMAVDFNRARAALTREEA